RLRHSARSSSLADALGGVETSRVVLRANPATRPPILRYFISTSSTGSLRIFLSFQIGSRAVRLLAKRPRKRCTSGSGYNFSSDYKGFQPHCPKKCLTPTAISFGRTCSDHRELSVAPPVLAAHARRAAGRS